MDWGARKLLGYEIMRLPGGALRRPTPIITCGRTQTINCCLSASAHADGLLHESHIHCWDVHPIADTAWPKEELVPGFKCAVTPPGNV